MEVVRACHTLRRTPLLHCRSTSKTGAIVRYKLRARIRRSHLVAQVRVLARALVLLCELRRGEEGRCRRARGYHISQRMLPLRRGRTNKTGARPGCRRRARKCKSRTVPRVLVPARALRHEVRYQRHSPGRLAPRRHISRSKLSPRHCDKDNFQAKIGCIRIPRIHR